MFEELTNDLKKVTCLQDILNLEKKIDGNLFFVIEIVGKIRGYGAYHFTQARNPKKVDYLYADGISTGQARYENLHNALTFKIWYNGGMISGVKK